MFEKKFKRERGHRLCDGALSIQDVFASDWNQPDHTASQHTWSLGKYLYIKAFFKLLLNQTLPLP